MSGLEESLDWQIRAAQLPEPRRQYRFLENRRYRADFAWPGLKLLVELQGGKWVPGGGAHQRAKRWESDMERMNLAQLHGWILLQFSGDQVRSGEALSWIETAMEMLDGRGKGTAA